MAVCLSNGNVYILENEFNLDRDQVLNFFLCGHQEDILVIYENQQYKGCIIYESVLENSNILDAIIYEKLYISDELWEKARELLLEDEGKKFPVFDLDLHLLYFVKYSSELESLWKKLCELRLRVSREMWQNFKSYSKYIHIVGMNEVLYELRKWLMVLGTEVSVEGEKWKFFGVEEGVNVDKDIVVIDEGCKWLESLYAEYLHWLENDSKQLEKLLNKPYMLKTDVKDKIMFYVTPFSYFLESITPLIYRYLQSEKPCIVVFPSISGIIYQGRENIRKVIKLIKKIEKYGGHCFVSHEKQLYKDKYNLCFICSEYSGNLPMDLDGKVERVVSLQTTAIYVHMYGIQGRFNEVFSDQAWNEIDYLIASEYIADWICYRDKRWEKKILRFGYPKLDKLYHSMKVKPDIPVEWEKKVSGKKVILFPNKMKLKWMDFFEGQENMIVMWRPHPMSLADAQKKEEIEKIRTKYKNIIIDETPSYYAAFWVSEAIISNPYSSVMINYLYTGKPVCIFDEEHFYRQTVIDYREEEWYKSAYVTYNDKELFEFVKMVRDGAIEKSEDREQRRRYVIKGFDGNVCNRIYDYFEREV